MRTSPFLLIALLLMMAKAFGQDSSNARVLFHWSDTSLPASSAFNNTYNETWGYAANGREYAIIGSTEGTHIFDITVPDSAYLADFVAGAYQGSGVVHRDYHDYNGYLYMVCDEGAGTSTLQIADLSYLPDSVHVAYDSDALFTTSHNIFIDTATAKLYACFVRHSGSGPLQGLEVFSLANPTNPQLLKSTDNYGYVHDAYVRNDTAFLNSGYDGLYVVDFTNTASPQAIGSLYNYPYKGYNHSGWLSEDGSIYAFADENHGFAIKVCDATDLADITPVSYIKASNDTLSIPHNLIIKGNLLFVSYYYDGLQIFDISDPANPVKMAWYDTYPGPHNGSHEGAWGVFPNLSNNKVLISDMQSGLFVFAYEDSLNNLPTTDTPAPTQAGFSAWFSQDALVVEIAAGHSGDRELTVLDVSGKKLYHKRLEFSGFAERHQIPLGHHIAAGTLIVQLRGQKATFARKVFKPLKR